MAGGPLELWNHRSMQILVLLSLGLQVVLFVFAGIRRRETFPVRRLLLWLAYLMADSTAVYAVGHLSFSSTVREHQLVAFWAPFLLLHLGGPDNITAYALQDNQLWLRHLQILIVQVLGAAYVLHKNIGGGSSGTLLWLASRLMFAVGVVKYGERTWALKCGTLESIGASVKTQLPAIHKHFHRQDEASEEEFVVRRAHSLFHVCKRAIVDSSVIEKDSVEGQEEYTAKMMLKVELWALMEIELSLMYHVLYTKAAVVHSLFGYLVRVVSPLTTAASLLLFQLTPKEGHDRADIAITYVLLGGALFMETTSLLNALGSSWTFAFLSTTKWRWLRYVALCSGRWDSLRRRVVSLHHLVKGGFPGGSSRYKSRRWSYTIGQYNMLHFCTRPADTPLTSPLLGRLARTLGPSEWWNRKYYSGTVKISDSVQKHLSTHGEDVQEWEAQLPEHAQEEVGRGAAGPSRAVRRHSERFPRRRAPGGHHHLAHRHRHLPGQERESQGRGRGATRGSHRDAVRLHDVPHGGSPLHAARSTPKQVVPTYLRESGQHAID